MRLDDEWFFFQCLSFLLFCVCYWNVPTPCKNLFLWSGFFSFSWAVKLPGHLSNPDCVLGRVILFSCLLLMVITSLNHPCIFMTKAFLLRSFLCLYCVSLTCFSAYLNYAVNILKQTSTCYTYISENLCVCLHLTIFISQRLANRCPLLGVRNANLQSPIGSAVTAV